MYERRCYCVVYLGYGVPTAATAADLDPVLCQQLAHCAHELAPRVNLEKLGPPQGAPLVNPRQGIGDLCSGLASQRLSLLVAAGDVNDRESVAKGLPPHAVMQQKEQVSLVDLVRRGDVEFWSRDVLWGREVDLPDRWPAS